jgi:hypothetical protein
LKVNGSNGGEKPFITVGKTVNDAYAALVCKDEELVGKLRGNYGSHEEAGVRVNEDKHWVSSNLFGGALGYFVAKWVVDLHEKKDKEFQSISTSPLISISVALD